MALRLTKNTPFFEEIVIQHPAFSRVLTALRISEPFTYSICTIVTRPAEYQEMCANFIAHGFDPRDTEFLSVDNSRENSIDAFTAYNLFLSEARSPYIILCHQDVQLVHDGRVRLDEIIRTLHRIDPGWGLCGNAGKTFDGLHPIHISDPRGDHLAWTSFPTRVVSLDENFIVVRRSANLAVSSDLHGFHMYGTDLCLIAEVLGRHAYVVDFHLLHKSGGTFDDSLSEAKDRFRKKYSFAFRPRWVYLPTPGDVFLTTSETRNFLARVLKKLRRKLRLR